jgi:branched-chain amino acid transport system permease protein
MAVGVEASWLRHLLWAVAAGCVGVAAVWFADDFTVSQLAKLAALICVAFGFTVLVGVNGQISLGHAALMAVGAYSMAMFLEAVKVSRPIVDPGPFDPERETGVSVAMVVVGLVVAVVATIIVGTVIGLAAARLRGPYLAGATLALGVAVHGVTTSLGGLLKGEEGIASVHPFMPRPLADLGWKDARLAALIAVACAAITLFLAANLKRSAIGRHLGAVRDHEIAAQLCGLSVPREHLRAFVVSAASAGLGGALIGLSADRVNPGTYSLVLSLTILTAIVIGGLGSLRGAVWGCVIVVFLDRLLADAQLNENAPAAIYGVVLIVVMLAAPAGIQGLLSRLGGVLPRRVT